MFGIGFSPTIVDVWVSAGFTSREADRMNFLSTVTKYSDNINTVLKTIFFIMGNLPLLLSLNFGKMLRPFRAATAHEESH